MSNAEHDHDRRWEQQERMVMSELRRLNIEVDQLTIAVTELKIQLATLTAVVQLKSGVWGALAGFIPALGMLLLWFMGKK